MLITNVKTEVGVVILLTVSLLVGILTVVGFNKTAKDLEKIEKSVQANQQALDEVIKKMPQNNLK